MENSRDSYLLTNSYYNIPELPILEYTNNNNDLIYIPNYLSEDELNPLDKIIFDIRTNMIFNESNNIGEININSDNINHKFKYIAHQSGRYDIWNIAKTIKKPLILNNLIQKSIGCLFLNAHTFTHGKWHKDTVELFECTQNSSLPPFYYNMMIATSDINIDNGPTQFLIDNIIYWVPMKRGDAIIFNGEVIHRGSSNISNQNRDLIYAIYTKSWYDEEKL